MNLLLIDSATAISLTVFAVIALCAIFIVVGLKNGYKSNSRMVTKHEPRIFNLEINNEYVSSDVMKFLVELHKALPSDLIAFPKVGVSNLVIPKNDKLAYNAISDQFVDVCIFLRHSMQPILAIDLYDNSATSILMKQLPSCVIKAMDTVGIPILRVLIKDEYDIKELRKTIVNELPAKIVTILKEQITGNN